MFVPLHSQPPPQTTIHEGQNHPAAATLLAGVFRTKIIASKCNKSHSYEHKYYSCGHAPCRSARSVSSCTPAVSGSRKPEATSTPALKALTRQRRSLGAFAACEAANSRRRFQLSRAAINNAAKLQVPARPAYASVRATCHQHGKLTSKAAATFGVGGSAPIKKSPKPDCNARGAHGSERAQPAGRPVSFEWSCGRSGC